MEVKPNFVEVLPGLRFSRLLLAVANVDHQDESGKLISEKLIAGAARDFIADSTLDHCLMRGVVSKCVLCHQLFDENGAPMTVSDYQARGD